MFLAIGCETINTSAYFVYLFRGTLDYFICYGGDKQPDGVLHNSSSITMQPSNTAGCDIYVAHVAVCVLWKTVLTRLIVKVNLACKRRAVYKQN